MPNSTVIPLAVSITVALTMLSAVNLVLANPHAAPDSGARLEQPDRCGNAGEWRQPGGNQVLPYTTLINDLSSRRVVLLGETHDNAEDHRWQLHTLAALHGRQPRLALGLEMFPRRLQSVLDRWVAGKLSEKEFLKQSEWDRVWSFDSELYLPLFHYARMHALPMLALNVERSLVSQVEAKGWDAVPAAEKEGISRPAAVSEAYSKELRQVYEHHPGPKSDAGFLRFSEAQSVWDRAMAEGIASFLEAHPDHQVVGIMGAGHVRNGHGVAHQLQDLGIAGVGSLITWDQALGCNELRVGLADAVFIKAEERDSPTPPRLGIAMQAHEAGVLIARVIAGSVAEQAGLKAEDILVQAAGRAVKDIGDIREAVKRQAPGTWLPLTVQRAGAVMDLVARFPAE